LIINKIKDPDGLERYRAVSSFEEVVRKPSLSKELMEVQDAYARLVENCRVQLKTLKSNRKNQGDSWLRWDLAKPIVDFIDIVEQRGYHFSNSSKALARDLGISTRRINYLIEFARTFPEKSHVYREISWDKYVEILDIKNRLIQKKIIQKILSGELKTREDIREFKKHLM